MSKLDVFLKSNKKEGVTEKIAASTAFCGTDGAPMLWEIRALKSKEVNHIRKACTVLKKGKEVEVDTGKFNAMIAAKCTVYPNLNDKELQDSYGVMSAEALIEEMLDQAGEYQNYVAAVMRLSGFDKTEGQLVEEAKN